MNFVLNLCFLLFLLVPYLDAAKFRCDYTYKDEGWYRYFEIPATWIEAKLRCHIQGATLASPTTATIKSNMVKYIGSTAIFTGIRTFSKRDFYSINGTPLDSFPHNWAKNEPNNLNNEENCLALNSFGELSDEKCDIRRPFICYRDNDNLEDLRGSRICGFPHLGYNFESRTNKCYKFLTTPLSFIRAYLFCAGEGGRLAIINSEVESKVIKDLFAQYPASEIPEGFSKDVAFVGFRKWRESGDWRTIEGDTLENATFSKFSAGEPNNATGEKKCGSVNRNGELNHWWCEKRHVFICEKNSIDPPVCKVEVIDEQTQRTLTNAL